MSYGPPQHSAAGNQANQYKTQQILTATQEEIMLMLYDGAIKFLMIAKKAMAAGDIQKAHDHLLKTQNIISEFMATLDMEIGGEVAKNLYSLYDYYNYRLVQANMNRDTAMIDEVLGHLRDLKKTWEEAVVIAAKEKAAEKSGDAYSELQNGLISKSDAGENYSPRSYDA